MYVACIRVSMYAYKNCILVTGYLSTLHRPGNVIAVVHCIDLGAIATPGTSLPVDRIYCQRDKKQIIRLLRLLLSSIVRRGGWAFSTLIYNVMYPTIRTIKRKKRSKVCGLATCMRIKNRRHDRCRIGPLG